MKTNTYQHARTHVHLCSVMQEEEVMGRLSVTIGNSASVILRTLNHCCFACNHAVFPVKEKQGRQTFSKTTGYTGV